MMEVYVIGPCKCCWDCMSLEKLAREKNLTVESGLWLRRIDRIDKMTIALTNLDSGFKPNRNHSFHYSQMDRSPKFLTSVVASSCAIMSSPSSPLKERRNDDRRGQNLAI